MFGKINSCRNSARGPGSRLSLGLGKHFLHAYYVLGPTTGAGITEVNRPLVCLQRHPVLGRLRKPPPSVPRSSVDLHPHAMQANQRKTHPSFAREQNTKQRGIEGSVPEDSRLQTKGQS